jgi:hypothetical protein
VYHNEVRIGERMKLNKNVINYERNEQNEGRGKRRYKIS